MFYLYNNHQVDLTKGQANTLDERTHWTNLCLSVDNHRNNHFAWLIVIIWILTCPEYGESLGPVCFDQFICHILDFHKTISNSVDSTHQLWTMTLKMGSSAWLMPCLPTNPRLPYQRTRGGIDYGTTKRCLGVKAAIGMCDNWLILEYDEPA